ncbi:ribonuclease H-like domain-containing protein [Methanocalculus sp.]|uniref:ribonuclease H-like domain-containing protein n=1 Tax=Methanocalculus sp. TaxID=2004547 RepID=UPI0026062BAD|nr:ribonuclease H-like domain-containing protein [Methanocalculus sp.]MDG6249512.1 ribonuclease H-like domain-containing protein [Methanocalculus sp.]
MRILAFSDWRIQSIEMLIEYIEELDKKPDIIVYAGDDIRRFNKIPENKSSEKFREEFYTDTPNCNYFEKIAQYSKHGLVAVAGNDDPPLITNAIQGKNVYNIFKEPFIVEDYIFIGQEGSTKGPGFLIYSENEVLDGLNRKSKQYPSEKIIIVSHTPPFGILDVGLRFGINHIGSTALTQYIDENNSRIKAVICGHAHSQGGKETNYNGVRVVNCASHDNDGEPGKVCNLVIRKYVQTKWDLIFEWGSCPKEIHELMQVPMIGHARAKALTEIGVKSVDQLAKANISEKASKYSCFRGGVLSLIQNYARAISQNMPIVVRDHPFFIECEKKKLYFFDAEYSPTGTLIGPFGIFLLGFMNLNGEVKQFFLDNPNDEEKLLLNFRNWLLSEKPTLIAYSSTSADRPQLKYAFEKFKIPTSELGNSFFDLFFECISTQSFKKQCIYLPIMGRMGLKEISEQFGYKQEHQNKIGDGLQALIEYEKYLETNDEGIKKELLEYNQSDLERTRFIFNYIYKIHRDVL